MKKAVETFFDTNVLFAATARSRSWHEAALRALEGGFADRSLYLSGQGIREYLSVATRPAEANGFGLTQAGALVNVRQFVARAVWLEEDDRVRDVLLQLLAEVPCLGKQVHDANIVATMLAHGVPRLLTSNPGDFARFAGLVQVTGLA